VTSLAARRAANGIESFTMPCSQSSSSRRPFRYRRQSKTGAGPPSRATMCCTCVSMVVVQLVEKALYQAGFFARSFIACTYERSSSLARAGGVRRR